MKIEPQPYYVSVENFVAEQKALHSRTGVLDQEAAGWNAYVENAVRIMAAKDRLRFNKECEEAQRPRANFHPISSTRIS